MWALIFTRSFRVISVRKFNVINYASADCAPFKAFTIDILTADRAFPTRFPKDNFAAVFKNVAVGASNAPVLRIMSAGNSRKILLTRCSS